MAIFLSKGEATERVIRSEMGESQSEEERTWVPPLEINFKKGTFPIDKINTLNVLIYQGISQKFDPFEYLSARWMVTAVSVAWASEDHRLEEKAK